MRERFEHCEGPMGVFKRKSSHDAAERAAATALTVGVPGRCPRCGGFGYIDQIDMVNKFQRQHCRECMHTWEYDFDDRGTVIDLTDSAVATQQSLTEHQEA